MEIIDLFCCSNSKSSKQSFAPVDGRQRGGATIAPGSLTTAGRIFGTIAIVVLAVSGSSLKASASGSIALRSTSTARTTTTDGTVTISRPAWVVPGDVMIAQLAVHGGFSQNLTAPAGWALIRRDVADPMIDQAIYSRVVPSSPPEPASYTWTYNSGNNAAVDIADFSGVSTPIVVDVSNAQVNTSSTATITAPSVTIQANHTQDLLLGMFAIADGSSITVPAGTNKVWGLRAIGWGGVGIAMSYVNPASSGASGNWVATAGKARPNVGVLLALLPATEVSNATPVPTATATTATPSPISTQTAISATATLDPTASPAWSLTATSTPTRTPTATSTETWTPMATSTATWTPTATSTATWTPTPAASSTPRPTSTPAPTPSAAPTPVPTLTPNPSPTPLLNAYYVDNSSTGCGGSGCSDSNNGTSPLTAWRTIAHVQSIVTTLTPGQAVLFARGDTWNEQLSAPGSVNGSPGRPITFGNYGVGALPVIDGGSTRVACFDFEGSGSGSSPVFSYITVDGFECRNTTQHAVEFLQLSSSNASGMPGIIVQNMYIHNTGPGAYAGGSGPNDPGPYQYTGQLMLEDFGRGPSGIRLLNNTIRYVGGHNAIRVEGDTGGPLIEGNNISQWVHNAIDQKGVTNSIVDGNVIHDNLPGDTSPGMYTENTGLPAKVDSITFQRNVAYNVITGIQCEDLSPGGGVTVCHIYNNTLLASGQAIYGDANSPCNINWDVRNNILDSTSAMYQGGNCGNSTIWNYNDDCATQNSCQVKINGSLYTSVSALQASGHGTNDLWRANPLYVDAAANDYQLQTASPLSAAGLASLVSGMTDIGAY